MKLALSQVASIVSAGGGFEHRAVATGYSIDSRTIQPGGLFFAVRGERLDGHDYVEAALSRDAIAAVVSNAELARFADRSRLLTVDDPLAALQQLSAAVRKIWGKPLLGITGSAGKTTTKEIVAHVLSTRYKVLKSEGNLNNHFGLPLQLLKLESEHDMAVIEMGMSHAGEIAALAKLAQPNCGVVTLVAPVHLEYFESIEGIACAKYELIQSLPADGIAVLNADDEYVSQFGRDFRGKVITFGLRQPADVAGRKIQALGAQGTSFEIVSNGETMKATLPLLGEHSIYNALAGVAVGLQYGVSLSTAAGSLASLRAAERRGEIFEHNGVTIINDCYNSNPIALASMVQSLLQIPGKRHIVVAGEMLELGPSGEKLHADSGRLVGESGVDFVVGVRGLAKHIVDAASAQSVSAEFVATPEEAGEWMRRNLEPGDVVLLKASRGVRLERALETWVGKTVGSSH